MIVRFSAASTALAAVLLLFAPSARAAEHMTLASTDFAANASMPQRLAYKDDNCGGENATPSLAWRNAPKGVKSFALVMHDPDAPIAGGWYHWVVYDITPTSQALSPTGGFVTGRNSWGKSAYGGPCPPPGPAHHYVFTLYALDLPIGSTTGAVMTGPQVEASVRGHVLAKATLTGLYKR